MKSIFLVLFVIFQHIYCDPLPMGGADCVNVLDCGGPGHGLCVDSVCYCDDRYANPDCSYTRVKKDLAGGLQFLCIVGIGGVGEFIAGNTAWAWMELSFLTIIALISSICLLCSSGGSDICIGIVSILLSLFIICGFLMTLIRGYMMLTGNVNDGSGYEMY